MFLFNTSKLKRPDQTDADSLARKVSEVNSDGLWSWFSEPSCYVYNGYTFIGSTSSTGAVTVTKVSSDGASESFDVATFAEVDDHNNASFLDLGDGRLLVAYSDHTNSDSHTYIRVCNDVSDITNSANWDAQVEIPNRTGWRSSYANPFLFSDGVVRIIKRENQSGDYRIALISCPLADIATPVNWVTTTFMTGRNGTERPYIRWSLNEEDSDRVDIFCTDSHPDSIASGLYHCYVKNEGGALKYYQSDGTLITASILNVQTTMTRVEQPDVAKFWVWDIKSRGDKVRALGQRHITGTEYDYYLYEFDGSAWSSRLLFDPAFTYSLYAGQQSYTGGICFDATNWDKFFVARPSGDGNGIDMTEWRLDQVNGNVIKIADIAFNSSEYNARPSSPKNWQANMPRAVWWRGTYTTYTNFTTAVMVYQ